MAVVQARRQTKTPHLELRLNIQANGKTMHSVNTTTRGILMALGWSPSVRISRKFRAFQRASWSTARRDRHPCSSSTTTGRAARGSSSPTTNHFPRSSARPSPPSVLLCKHADGPLERGIYVPCKAPSRLVQYLTNLIYCRISLCALHWDRARCHQVRGLSPCISTRGQSPPISFPFPGILPYFAHQGQIRHGAGRGEVRHLDSTT